MCTVIIIICIYCVDGGGRGDGGKECSEVSDWYNIPGHSTPVPVSTCEHVAESCPKWEVGSIWTVACAIAARAHWDRCGVAWYIILIRDFWTLFSSFLIHPIFTPPISLKPTSLRQCVIYSAVDYNNDVCQSCTINHAQHEAQQAQQAPL